MQFQPDASNAPSNTNIYLIMIYCAWNPPESTRISGLIFFYLKFFYILLESTQTPQNPSGIPGVQGV